MKLIRLAAALVALFAAQAVHAGSVRLICTAPTTNTDGSALTNLAGYRWYGGTSAANLGLIFDSVNPSRCEVNLTGLAPATWYFAVTAYNTEGGESAKSNVVSQVVDGPSVPLPSAPTNVTLTSRPVYTIKQTADNLAVVPVGTVPAQTPCDGTRGVIAASKAYYRVPTGAVTWAGTVRSVVVFADCS